MQGRGGLVGPPDSRDHLTKLGDHQAVAMGAYRCPLMSAGACWCLLVPRTPEGICVGHPLLNLNSIID